MVTGREIRAGAAYVELYVKSSKLVAGLQRASRRLRSFGAGVSQLGRQMVRLSAAMSIPFAIGANEFANFEEQMARVATLLDNPVADLERFSDGVRALSRNFGQSTETLAGGLYDILSASVPASKALDVLEVSTKAAAAGMTDVNVAADALTTVLNAYNLSADEAGKISDLMFQTVRRGKTTFPELANGIGNVASVAASAGVRFEEVSAILASMTRNGVKTDTAITSLTAIMSAFLKPTEGAAKAAAQYGVELNSATLQSEGLLGVLEKLDGLPPDVIAKIFPNVRAVRGLLPALSNVEAFREDVEAMQGSAGATEDAFGIMSDTIKFKLNQLKQSGMDVFRTIGEAIADSIGNSIEVASRWVAWVGIVIEKNQELVRTAFMIAGAIGAVGAGLVLAGTAVSAIGFALSGLAGIVTAVSGVLGTLAGAVAFLASPIGLVIGALALLGTYFFTATETGVAAIDWLVGKFSNMGERFRETIGAIGDALAAGEIGTAARVLWSFLKAEFLAGIGVLRGYWLDFKGFFLEQWNNAVYGLLKLIAPVWNDLESLWNDIVSNLLKGWNVFVTALRVSWNSVNGWVEEQFTRFFLWLDGTTGEAADATIKEIQRRTEKTNEKYVTELEQRQEDLDKRQEKRRREIQQQDTLSGDEISKALDAEQAATKKAIEAERAESDKAVQDAREEWRQALADAKNARKKAEQDAEEDAPEIPEMPSLDDAKNALEDIQKNVGSLGEVAARQTAEVQVLGTFNAATASRFATGSAADRTADATEETAKNTKKLLEKASDGGLVFE